MPKYYLPNGKAVFTEQEVTPEKMDDFMSSMMGGEKKPNSLAISSAPKEEKPLSWWDRLTGKTNTPPPESKSVKGDLNSVWRNAATIGAPKIGEHYVDDPNNMSLLDRIRKLTVGDARPRTTQALDPFGIEAAKQGKGPVPVFGMAEDFHNQTGALARIAKPPEIDNIQPPRQPSFIAGEKGVVPNTSPLAGPIARGSAILEDSRPTVPTSSSADTAAIQEQNRVNSIRGSQGWNGMTQVGQPPPRIHLPAESGDTRGGFSQQSNANLKYPENVVPNAVRPRNVQSDMLRHIPDDSSLPGRDIHSPEPLTFSDGKVEEPIGKIRDPHEESYPGTVGDPELPSATPRPTRKQLLEQERIKSNTTAPTEPNNTATPKVDPNITKSDAIDAIQRWADGRLGAKVKGSITAESFKDLDDPSLVHKFETGDRTGRLADVQKFNDENHAKLVAAGILKENQKLPDYLRLDYDEDPAKVTEATRAYFAKNPSIAKERNFLTHEDAKAAGLNPKYSTIPEMMGSYEQKVNEALKNKELYDYLTSTNQMKKADFLTTSPRDWEFQGPNAKAIAKTIGNVFDQSPDWLKRTADASSVSKNITLSGGIPGTKYNMHTWNIAKSDAKLAGFWKATKELFSDPTGKNADVVFEQHKDLLPELVDHGYEYRPIDDAGDKVSGFLGDNIAGRATSKLVGAYQNTFEKPLFEKSLPALKLKRTADVFDDLLKTGMDRDTALTQASKIGNEFYGGINKKLRSSVTNDISRIVFLAPDWLESRVRVAAGDFKGAAKVLMNSADAVDKIHAKSFARGAGMSAATLGIGAAAKGTVLSDKPSDSLTLPLGKDSIGKNRELSVFGTSDEGQRVPIETALKAYQGNPGGLIELLIQSRMSNLVKATDNLRRGQNDFGDAIRGTDKYGKQIGLGQSIVYHLQEMTRPAQLQAIQAMLKYAAGKASLEETVSTGLELPLKYATPSRDPNGMRIGSIPKGY